MNYPSAIDASYTLPLRSELSAVRILFTVFAFPRSIDSERRQFSEKGIRLEGRKQRLYFQQHTKTSAMNLAKYCLAKYCLAEYCREKRRIRSICEELTLKRIISKSVCLRIPAIHSSFCQLYLFFIVSKQNTLVLSCCLIYKFVNKQKQLRCNFNTIE